MIRERLVIVKSALCLTLLLLSFVLSVPAQQVKIVQGKVGQLEYPRFSLINFKVQLDNKTAYRIDWNGTKQETPLRPELLKEGADVEARGLLDGKTNTIQAQTVTFLLKVDYISELGGTALIQRPTQLKKGADRWSGIIH